MKTFRSIFKWAHLPLLTGACIVVGAAAVSAYEAHVVNVKAVVENALTVSTESIEFGDVLYPFINDPFNTRIAPPLVVSLSDSFLASDRLEGVNYVLKLKPKVKLSCDSPQAPQPCEPLQQPYPGDPWADVTVGSSTVPAWQYCEENLPGDASTTDAVAYTVDFANPYWQRCYLPLGGWLALVKNLAESSSSTATLPTMLATDFLTVDREVLSFHQPYLWNASGTSELATSSIAEGVLSKNASDTVDYWHLGLATPCFYGFCKPGADDIGKLIDWKNMPRHPLPNDYYVPQSARLDPATEHYPYGADLWIEVTGFSYSTSSPSSSLPGLRVGQLVQYSGTIYLIGDNGRLVFPDLNVFNSWCFSFADVLPMNPAELASPYLGSVETRAPLQSLPANVSKLVVTNCGGQP